MTQLYSTDIHRAWCVHLMKIKQMIIQTRICKIVIMLYYTYGDSIHGWIHFSFLTIRNGILIVNGYALICLSLKETKGERERKQNYLSGGKIRCVQYLNVDLF